MIKTQSRNEGRVLLLLVHPPSICGFSRRPRALTSPSSAGSDQHYASSGRSGAGAASAGPTAASPSAAGTQPEQGTQRQPSTTNPDPAHRRSTAATHAPTSVVVGRDQNGHGFQRSATILNLSVLLQSGAAQHARLNRSQGLIHVGYRSTLVVRNEHTLQAGQRILQREHPLLNDGGLVITHG